MAACLGLRNTTFARSRRQLRCKVEALSKPDTASQLSPRARESQSPPPHGPTPVMVPATVREQPVRLLPQQPVRRFSPRRSPPPPTDSTARYRDVVPRQRSRHPPRHQGGSCWATCGRVVHVTDRTAPLHGCSSLAQGDARPPTFRDRRRAVGENPSPHSRSTRRLRTPVWRVSTWQSRDPAPTGHCSRDRRSRPFLPKTHVAGYP